MKTTPTSLAPTANKLERLKKYIKSSTPLERLVFACLTFYGTCVLILDILER